MTLSAQTAIVGIGQTPFTRGTDFTTLELHLQAALEAISDAGLTPADIDGVMPNELAGTIAEDFILNLGLPALAFSSTIRTGGASFVSAIQSAALAVAGGVANNVLLVAGRRGYSAQRVSRTSEGAIAPHPVMRDTSMNSSARSAIPWRHSGSPKPLADTCMNTAPQAKTSDGSRSRSEVTPI